jgi:hypothetical protein
MLDGRFRDAELLELRVTVTADETTGKDQLLTPHREIVGQRPLFGTSSGRKKKDHHRVMADIAKTNNQPGGWDPSNRAKRSQDNPKRKVNQPRIKPVKLHSYWN